MGGSLDALLDVMLRRSPAPTCFLDDRRLRRFRVNASIYCTRKGEEVAEARHDQARVTYGRAVESTWRSARSPQTAIVKKASRRR
jgi:hypothetical protein